MSLKVKENPDKKIVKELRKELKKNNGYCPNALIQDNEHKCMCKEFREKETPGYSNCGLYYKE